MYNRIHRSKASPVKCVPIQLGVVQVLYLQRENDVKPQVVDWPAVQAKKGGCR